MSLVNQMLKDLEQRRAQLPAGDSLRGLHAAPTTPAPARRWPLLLLAVAVAGGAVGVWYAQSVTTLSTDVIRMPVAAAPISTTDTIQVAATQTAAPMAADAVPPPRAHATMGDQNNAAEYVSEVDAEWDRDWLAEMNAAVSVASLEEHRMESAAPLAADEPPPVPAPAKARTPDKPAPKPTGTTTTAVASAGSMHKTPRTADPQATAAQHYARAVTLLRDGDRAGAESALRGALAAHPGDATATQALAALLLQEGRRSEAETVLAEALTQQPAQPALTILRARLLAENGRDRDAVVLLEPLKDAEAQALLGALQQRLGNDTAAALAYQNALTSAPREGAWWLGLAISLERTQQPAAALQAYRRALADARLEAQVNGYVRSRIAALGDGRG